MLRASLGLAIEPPITCTPRAHARLDPTRRGVLVSSSSPFGICFCPFWSYYLPSFSTPLLAWSFCSRACPTFFIVLCQAHGNDGPRSVPQGVVSGLKYDPSGRDIVFNVDSAVSPGNVYSHTVKTRPDTVVGDASVQPAAGSQVRARQCVCGARTEGRHGVARTFIEASENGLAALWSWSAAGLQMHMRSC